MAESIYRALRDGALEGELAPALTIKDSVASPFALQVFSHRPCRGFIFPEPIVLFGFAEKQRN
ncbi:hypothetical protein Gotri_007326 [Gossypium trilobum]|uniref:Uncharacterized protein n=3 Tax=Gossypium TaxID=3633 RepID=A0A7J9EFQ7_9ROSI|nr:hypothetical protein [Gossypium davidsonii]MBA0655454.1 hypothetical protein [Gossypium klotzschianum]MBA0771860.1 hypothetical protein [Gossypium trilobum]